MALMYTSLANMSWFLKKLSQVWFAVNWSAHRRTSILPSWRWKESRKSHMRIASILNKNCESNYNYLVRCTPQFFGKQIAVLHRQSVKTEHVSSFEVKLGPNSPCSNHRRCNSNFCAEMRKKNATQFISNCQLQLNTI